MTEKIIIFDLDGTLSLTDHRQHFLNRKPSPDWDGFFNAAKDDLPNVPIIELFRSLQQAGHKLLLWTGRSNAVSSDTLEWLTKYGVYPTHIRMREANDHRADVIIKKEWLDSFLNGTPKENILFAVDDRKKVVDMWRSEGIICLQVAEGEF